MSTRSTIGILEDDGSVTAIYCHSDGYLDWVGSMLAEHYTDSAKVRTLIEQGDMSSIGEEIGSPHAFDDRPANECTFYGRDRGEEGTEPKTHPDRETWRKGARDQYGAEFGYLWDGSQWLYWEGYSSPSEFAELAPAIAGIEL